MRFVASACGLIVLASVVACGGGGPVGGPASSGGGTLTADEISRLIDDPGSFKGKTVKAELFIDQLPGMKPLSEQGGKAVKFYGYGKGMAHLNITITMPAEGKLPSATQNDKLIVTFTCKEGSLRSGNEATRVERP